MQAQVHPVQQSWVGYAIPIAIVVVVMVLRLRSMNREQPLKLGTLWIVPVLYLLIAGSMLFALMPTPMGWGLLLAGLAAGLGLGWHRGKLIRIARDPQSGELRQRASPLALVLLAALIALKLGARAIFGDSAAPQPGSSAILLTDTFLGFALGLLSATRLEIYLRAKQLLANSE
jgi:hypothetical protein